MSRSFPDGARDNELKSAFYGGARGFLGA